MAEPSTKPYLIRAIHEWCTDAGYTPYIAVLADDTTRVPREFVKNGEIVLNISSLATSRLTIGNEAIEFQARFSGQAREVYVPVDRVIAVYARENGQGMAFEVARAGDPAGMEPASPTAAPVALVAVPSPAPAQPPAVVGDARTTAREVQGPRAVPAATDTEPPSPPPATPAPGDRPRLTRIK